MGNKATMLHHFINALETAAQPNKLVKPSHFIWYQHMFYIY